MQVGITTSDARDVHMEFLATGEMRAIYLDGQSAAKFSLSKQVPVSDVLTIAGINQIVEQGIKETSKAHREFTKKRQTPDTPGE